MGTLSEYGKVLRHLRIDRQMLLGTMADDLEFSPAYLSSIETGARKIPPELSQKVIQKYNLSDEEKENLLRAEAETKKSLTIDLNDAPPEAFDTTAMFAREVKKMTVKELRDLYDQMCRHGEKE